MVRGNLDQLLLCFFGKTRLKPARLLRASHSTCSKSASLPAPPSEMHQSVLASGPRAVHRPGRQHCCDSQGFARDSSKNRRILQRDPVIWSRLLFRKLLVGPSLCGQISGTRANFATLFLNFGMLHEVCLLGAPSLSSGTFPISRVSCQSTTTGLCRASAFKPLPRPQESERADREVTRDLRHINRLVSTPFRGLHEFSPCP